MCRGHLTWARLGSLPVWALVTVGCLALVGGVAGVGWRIAGAAWPTSPATPHVADEVPMTAMDLRRRSAVTSPEVAVDATSDAFVAAATRQDVPQAGCRLQVSGDGGQTWLPVDAIGELPQGVDGCYAPSVGFTPSGRLVFSFVGLTGAPPRAAGLFVVTSDDHAQSFTQPRRIAEVASVATAMAVNSEGIQAVWLEPGERATGSASGGRWPVGERVIAAADSDSDGSPMLVADPEGLVAAPTIETAADGEVVVAYYELPADAHTDGGAETLLGAGPWRLMVTRKTDQDSGFGEPVAVAELELPAVGAEPPVRQPRLVASRGIAAPGVGVREERACVSWTDTTSNKELAAWARCVTDRGQSWSEPVRLGGGGKEAWLPQVTVSDSGAVEAVFYGRDRQGDSLRTGVYYVVATPGEDGFGAPLRLSSHGSHPAQAPLAGWYGTRLGLAAGPETTVAAWADSRNAIPTVFPSQVVFAATVDPPALHSGSAGWIGGVLLASGMVAVATGAWLWRRRAAGAGPADEAEGAGTSLPEASA